MDVLSPKEYAKRFGYHPRTVYRAIKEQRLRHRWEYVIGRTIRIYVPREGHAPTSVV